MEKSPKSSRLENMLAGIKQLKEESYIGSEQAWRYLKFREMVHTSTESLSNEINSSLRRKFSDIRYKASPKIVLGVCDMISKAYNSIIECDREEFIEANEFEGYEDSDEAYEKQYGSFLDEDNAGFKFMQENPLLNWRELILGFEVYIKSSLRSRIKNHNEYLEDLNIKPKPKVLIDYILPLFEEMQNLLSLDDSDSLNLANDYFGNLALLLPIKTHGRIMPLEFQNIIRNKFLLKIDWNPVFSRERQRKIERELLDNEKFLLFDTRDQFERMQREGVLKEFYYRRQLLTNYLLMADFKNYDEADRSMRDRLSDSTERSGEFNKLNAPEVLIKKENNLLEYKKILLRTLHQEKNFVNKFLNS